MNDEKSRYNFTWNKVLRLVQPLTTGTLRACPEKGGAKTGVTPRISTSRRGNLEVLKLLQKSYHGKIKMIYIEIIIPSLIQDIGEIKKCAL